MASQHLLLNTIGAAAGLCSMLSFIPQIRKIIHTRDASAVSLKTYLVTALGFALWTAFGFLQRSWPLTASNGVCLILVAVIIGLRLSYGDDSRA